MNTAHIRLDDLSGPEIAALLQEHLDDMYRSSPPESVHALDLEKLRQAEIQLFTLWDGDKLAGCGALTTLDPTHGEIKSMRTANNYRRRGIAAQILEHLIATAKEQGLQRLSLETGSMAFFAPARAMYEKFGFEYCAPFGDYIEDPNSQFMTRKL